MHRRTAQCAHKLHIQVHIHVHVAYDEDYGQRCKHYLSYISKFSEVSFFRRYLNYPEC